MVLTNHGLKSGGGQDLAPIKGVATNTSDRITSIPLNKLDPTVRAGQHLIQHLPQTKT